MDSNIVRFGLVAFLALGLAGSVSGQRLEDGEVTFESNAKKTREMRKQIFKGETPADAKEKSHMEAIDYAARESTYPLYWYSLGKVKPGDINRVVDTFAERLQTLNKFRPTTNSMLRLYCKEVIDRAAEVIQKGKPIAGINACRVLATLTQRRVDRGVVLGEKAWVEECLPRLAEGNAEHLANTCLTLLADPKITDGHRYYLYRCLGDLLALPPQTPLLLKQDIIEKVLQLALKQVEKKVAFPRATPRKEVEGYKVLREQAVVILAAARQPTLGDKERPALTLARVAGGDTSLVPPPRFSERMEAAIGLARLGTVSGKFPDLQMDYVANMIVVAVVEFGKEANNTIENPEPRLRLRPWAVDAARLIEALDELRTAVKLPYVQEALKECQTVLSQIEAKRKSPANTLGDWLSKNPAPSKSLFKSDPASTVKGPAVVAE